ncbi:hypothetical protein POG22_13770, partial [Geitlerinema sp. CS-897]|nr:hypothetical protein [Geitlerinema sp. CS-897]
YYARNRLNPYRARVFAKLYKKSAQIAKFLSRYRLQAFTLHTKVGRAHTQKSLKRFPEGKEGVEPTERRPYVN